MKNFLENTLRQKIYKEIKNELISNEINRRVKNYSINKSDLNAYYKVWKILKEAWKHYGEGIFKEYSRRITTKLKKCIQNQILDITGYSILLKCHVMCDELSWSHYRVLLSIADNKVKNQYKKTINKLKLQHKRFF